MGRFDKKQIKDIKEPLTDKDLEKIFNYIKYLCYQKYGKLPKQDKEDMISLAFERFLKYYRQGKYKRERGSLSTYVYQIATSSFKNYIKKESLHYNRIKLINEMLENY